jgi:hypothetical protein
MNLNIQNLSNSFKSDLRLFAQISGSSLILYPSRISYLGRTFYTVFYGDSFSKFPRDSSENFLNDTTTINFQSGTITGADAVSVDFSPITPSTGQAIVGIVSIDNNDRLYIRNSTSKSIAASTYDFENGVFPVQKGKIPLYGFLITNVSGTVALAKICDIKPDLGNIPFDTADIVFSNADNLSIGAVFREYLSENASSGSNEIRIKSTKLKRGDSISILSATTAAQVRTVLSVTPGSSYASVIVDQNLSSSVTVANGACVTLNTYSDLSQVFNSEAGRIIYDSNWRYCTTNTNETLTHNLNMPLGTYSPLLYFNTTQSMSGAVILLNNTWSSHGSKVGAQLRLTSTAAVVRFASTGIANTINSTGQNSGTLTTGYYRLILVGN